MSFFKKFKKSHNNSIKSRCFQGHIHPSRLEAGHCNLLEHNRKAGIVKKYTYEPRYNFIVNGANIGFHKPDFLVVFSDGEKEIHECKGRETAIWRIKRRLFKALYPELKYVVIK